ncbi:MAG: cellulase family glycosylhydrolase [Spirochaetales bacterium]|nr:cellulase family glycosylhydrolase [Spirochaetales bacterium]
MADSRVMEREMRASEPAGGGDVDDFVGNFPKKKAKTKPGGLPGCSRRENACRPLRGETFRRSVIVALLFIIVFYLAWRILFTFNPQYAAYSVIFILADCLTGLSTIGLALSLWKPRTVPDAPPLPGLSVDVFIPTFNEDIAILRRTIFCCVAMEYPHTTYVLDDGRRPEVKDLAESLGARYLTRENNRFGKAGNLNHALPRTNGDFIAVFDADFIPMRDFLTRLIGYFKDPGVALVQVPQQYYNLNSFQHRRRAGRVWNEQEAFFDLILKGRNNWNAAFWCGTNALLRRAALEEAGGFATESVTEDMLTSMRLHARGWRSLYVDKPLAYGLAPVNVRQFLIQRRRWAKGAAQIFSRNNPLFKKGLSLMQRLCYFFSVMHFFDGLSRLVFYTIPAVYLLTGVCPISRNPANIWIILGYIAVSIFSLHVIGRRKISFFNDELYGMIRFVAYLWGVVAGLFRRSHRFAVTPKDQKTKHALSSIVGPAAIFCLNVTAVFSKGYLFFHGGFTSVIFLVSLAGCFYFAIVALAALIISFSHPKTDSFLVHDTVFADVSGGGNGTVRDETCPVECWNESSAVIMSAHDYPRDTVLTLNVGDGQTATGGIEARIRAKTAFPVAGKRTAYRYELDFPRSGESEKLRVIGIAFQEGLRRQRMRVRHLHHVAFFPLLLDCGRDMVTSACVAGEKRLIVRFPRNIAEGARLRLRLPSGRGRLTRGEVIGNISYRGGRCLIVKTEEEPKLVRTAASNIAVKPRRAVNPLKLIPVIALLVATAFAVNSSYMLYGFFYRGEGPLDPPGTGVVAENGHLQVKGGRLCAENGAPVRLRGVSSHGPQWFPFSAGKTIPHCVEYFRINAVRMALYVEAFKDGRYWNGFVSQPEYMLDQANMFIRDAINNGIYVIISWHVHSDPLEYLSEAKTFFMMMSSKWGKYPNVIFEITNEPEGNIPWERIRRYAVGDPDDAGDGVIDVIRRSDPDDHDNVVIVGTPFWSQRADLVLEDPITEYDNIMYTEHFYAASHKADVRRYAQAALDGGLPLFVTEWGTAFHLSSGPMDLVSAREWIDWMDANDLSWMNWSFSTCDETTSALKPSASLSGPWTDDDLTPSGLFLKAELLK